MELTTVDTTSEAFGARLAAILRAARQDQERSLRVMAWRSRGVFSMGTLRNLEANQANLVGLDLASLASLYRIDLAALLQERVPLVVDVSAGTISTAGVARAFDTTHQDGLLLAYLHLVRDLRDLQEARSIALRREDVEVLATGLRADAAAVLDRLGELMGATVTQRRSAVAMFAAGAVLIVLSTGAVALESGLYPSADGGENTAEGTVVTLAAGDDLHARVELAGPAASSGPRSDTPVSDLDPVTVATAGPASADAGELGGPASGPSAMPAVIEVAPPVAPGGSPPAPAAAVGGVPVVDAPVTGVPVAGVPVAGAPVAEVPVVDVPRTAPSVPDAPAPAEAAPETPAPRVSSPVVVPPAQPQPGDRPAVDEPAAEVPSDEVAAGSSPVDGPPVDEAAHETPASDLPPTDVAPELDGPVSDGSPEGGDPEEPTIDAPDPADPDLTGPDPADPDLTGPDPAGDGLGGSGPGAGESGGNTPAPPVGDGGTPGNSPAVGNTPSVGTPGNSGNPNAGGGNRP
jgi:hypothetical protein